MIIDLNLKGKQVVVVGAGREARSKVEALLSQDCEIVVIADHFGEGFFEWSQSGSLILQHMKLSDGGFLKDYDRLILVMAATNDRLLNQQIVEAAKKLHCYAYAVDDPEISDFNHPAVINIYDTIQVAVSTGGRSPLMAGKIRKKIESALKELITKEDILKIQLQDRVRPKAKKILSSPEKRKKFLELILNHGEINQLLQMEKLDEAESLAWEILKKNF